MAGVCLTKKQEPFSQEVALLLEALEEALLRALSSRNEKPGRNQLRPGKGGTPFTLTLARAGSRGQGKRSLGPWCVLVDGTPGVKFFVCLDPERQGRQPRGLIRLRLRLRIIYLI